MAHDIVQGKLVLVKRGGELRLERRFHYLDANGEIIPNIGMMRFVRNISLSQVPQKIRTAMNKVDEWTYELILEDEGMS